MIITGIIAEFNPFHKGHQYIINKAKEQTNADYIIIIMSGDYVQRGECAIISKEMRCKSALICGADAVFMLPVIISTASAEYFARGSVALLNALGADFVFFGSESGDLSLLSQIKYQKGNIQKSNDILGSEYIKAIKQLNLSIKPALTKRIGSDYNDISCINGTYCSALYLRNQMLNLTKSDSEINNTQNSSNNDSLLTNIPNEIGDLFLEYQNNYHFLSINNFSDILFSKLLSENQYDNYFDVYNDLSNKIKSNLFKFNSFVDFINVLKSKDITYSHISRALLHILLNLTKEDISIVSKYNYAPYVRLIGFKKESDAVINYIMKNSNIPVITKLSNYEKNVSKDIASLISKDINSSNLYNYLSRKTKIAVKHEFQKAIVTI